MTKSLGCYCGGEERWKDREGKGCFQALTQTLMAHNPKRNSIYSLRMYGEEKAEPKQKVLIIEEKADSEQSPALKPHKNCHHCSMQRAHLGQHIKPQAVHFHFLLPLKGALSMGCA